MRILFTAYDIQPYRGSESSTSFNLVNHLSLKGVKIDVITRKNNVEACKEFFQTKNIDVNFIGIDIPRWVCFWKNKRFGSRLYYYLWQIYLITYIKQNKNNYDVYQCLNFHTDSTPHFLWLLKNEKNLIAWGPISHHPKLKLWESINFKSYLISSFKSLIRHLSYLSPPTKLAYKISDLILYPSFLFFPKTLPKEVIPRLKIFSQVASKDFSYEKENNYIKDFKKDSVNGIKFLVLGRLVPLKSIHLSIHAFLNLCENTSKNNFPCLDIYGEGPLLNSLLSITRKSRFYNLVSFKKPVHFSKMASIYSKYDYLLNFSPEGAGLTTAEAFSASLPVLTRSNTFVDDLLKSYGWKLSIDNKGNSLEQFINDSFNTLNKLPTRTEKEYTFHSQLAREIYEKHLNWSKKTETLYFIYQDLLKQK